MATLKVTKAVVQSLAAKPSRYIVWDATVPGFGVVVHPTGRKTFTLYYRTLDGTQRQPALGTFGAMTVEQARELACDLIAKVRAGADPSLARRTARDAATVNDAADRYLEEHARVHKKKRSADTDESNLNLHVRPRWGTRKVASITYSDVVALHMAMKETPGAANRIVALLSKMFNLCEAWGLRPLNSNPCKHVRKYPEKKLHTHLSELELARLAKVLREAEEAHGRVQAGHPREKDLELAELPVAIAAIRLLILTGMRKGEVLNLKWSEVDFPGQVLRLEDSKTGAKVIPLNGPAEELLKGQQRIVGSAWVFPGRNPRKPFVGLPKIAKRLYARAKLPAEFRPAHDFRHNFGTAGTGENFSLTMVGSLLGHKSPLTTKRYAKAAEDPQRVATEQIASRLTAAMSREVDES